MILLVANGYPPTAYGGVEIYAADLSRALSAAGHDVAVFCAEHRHDLPDGTLIEDSVAGIPVFRVVNDYKHISAFSATYLDEVIEDRFSEVVRSLSPDVVHFNHLIALSSRLPLITREAGIPSLFTFHDFWPLCQRVNLVDWRGARCPGPHAGDCQKCLTWGTPVQRIRTALINELRSVVPYQVRVSLRNALARSGMPLPALNPTPELLEQRYLMFRSALLSVDRILAPSRFVKEVCQHNGYPAHRIEVLSLGLSPVGAGLAVPRSQDVVRIGYIGPMLPLKGVDILVRAFRRVRSPGLQLDLYGRLDVMPSYTRWVKRLALFDRRIRFRGAFQPEERDHVYSQIDVLVLPSLAQETFSFVARESLLRRKPVVASQVGALTELISEGINGWLVEPGNVGELARILSSIADRPESLQDLQIPGPVDLLSVEDHLTRVVSIYRELKSELRSGL